MKKDVVLERLVKNDANMAALKRVANDLIENWASGSSIKETAFDTAKTIIRKESKIEAIKQFISELEQRAYGETN